MRIVIHRQGLDIVNIRIYNGKANKSTLKLLGLYYKVLHVYNRAHGEINEVAQADGMTAKAIMYAIASAGHSVPYCERIKVEDIKIIIKRICKKQNKRRK